MNNDDSLWWKIAFEVTDELQEKGFEDVERDINFENIRPSDFSDNVNPQDELQIQRLNIVALTEITHRLCDRIEELEKQIKK